MTRTSVAPAFVAGIACAALAACGDDTADTTAEPAATVTVTATATATETVTATPEPLPSERDCGQVGFEPQTDAGAFDIRATGVGCQVARKVAAVAEGKRGQPYMASGYSCTPTETTGQLPSVVYECVGPADQRIRFEAS